MEAATRIMTDTPSAASSQSRAAPSGGQILIARIRFLSAMAVAVALFYYVAWWAVRPADPQGAITLLQVNHSILAMAELLGLSIVASGIAVAICGAGAGHCGPLAIAVGLASLAVRGSNMDAMIDVRLTEAVLTGSAAAPFPKTELIAETWLWLALICVGFVVGRWVEGWFGPPPASTPSANDPVDSAGEIRQGGASVVLVTLLAYNIIRFAAGTPAEPTFRGQVYFAVGAAFCLSTLMALWFFKSVSRVWLMAAVALVATLAYSINGPGFPSAIDPGSLHDWLNLPLSAAARPLPIEYAALGAIGVFAGFIFMTMIRHATPEG